MKVSVAQVANGQIAGAGDLLSLLAVDDKASFASLLELGGGGHAADHRDEGNRTKQGNRSKEKKSHEGQTSALQNPKMSAVPNSPRLQTIPNVDIAPWQLESGDPRANEDAGNVSLSPSLAGTTNVAHQIGARPLVSDARAANALVPNREQVRDQNAAEMAPFHNLVNQELAEASEGATDENQDTAGMEPVGPPDGKGTEPAVAHSPSASARVIQLSSGTVDSGVQMLIPQSGMDPGSTEASVAQRPSTSNHETKLDREGQNPTVSAGRQFSDAPIGNGGGQLSASAPSQGVVDVVSSSAAGGHSQGNTGDTHRGSSDAKEVAAASRVATTQTPQGSTFAALGSAGSAHGHSTLINSIHPEPVQEPTPNTQLKNVPSLRVVDANTVRLFGSAVRSDLRVGVQTEAFGRVTIQTNTQGGQLSAQLSLENAKESAALAAHLPGLEQKIVQEHGLNASVRLVGGFDGGAGAGYMGRDQSGSSRREPEQYQVNVAMRPQGIGHDPSTEDREVERTLSGRKYWVSARLDVTV